MFGKNSTLKKKSIPAILLGMLFYCIPSVNAQVTISGNLKDLSGGMVRIADCEGHRSNMVGKVQVGNDGQFLLFFPKLAYTGFYIFEGVGPQTSQTINFPIWLDTQNVTISGMAKQGYENLLFSDTDNQFFQTQAKQINAHQLRLDWLSEGASLYPNGTLGKHIKKQQATENDALRNVYNKAIAAAPNPNLRQALVFRFQTDAYITPFPPQFDAHLLQRINWQHPQMLREPLVPEYLTNVLRHYLFHPSNPTPSHQKQFLLDYTQAVHLAFENAGPLRSAVLDLMAEGYQQIEAWDALALVDSLRGKPQSPIIQKTEINWASEDWLGQPYKATDFGDSPYLLVFWSPLCDHCQEQLPTWARDRKALAAVGIRLVGVAMDSDYLQRQSPQPEAAVFDVLLFDKNLQQPDGTNRSIADHFAFSSTPAFFLMEEGVKVKQRFPDWMSVRAYLAEKTPAHQGGQKP